MISAAHNVWVLGNGFLGSRLAEVCRRLGARVLCIDATTPAEVHGDAADETVLRAAACQVAPTLIFCCLSTRGQMERYEHTYLHPLRLLQRMFPTVEIVFCSSLSAGWGSSPSADILRQAEQLVLQRGGRVARLAALYGPGRCELLRRHLAGEPCLFGEDTRLLHYLHVEDAVQALLLLCSAPPGTCAEVVGETFTKGNIYACLAAWTGVPVARENASPSRRGGAALPEGAACCPVPGWKPRHSFRAFVQQEVQQ